MEEKKGGRCRANRDGSLLNNFIQNNWMIDLPTTNGLYTWNNKRVAPMQIASRLDRFLISDNAVHLRGEFIDSILPYSGSDHWPIALHWNRPGNSTRRPFRFEAFWLSHPDFYEFIRTTWQNCHPTEGTKMATFQKKRKYLKEEIKHWNRNTFGNIFKAKEILIQEMKAIQQKMISEGRSEELAQKEQIMENKLLERDAQEETLWRQKSRIRWLKEAISLQEVEAAVNHLKAGKAPGPDGFTSNFFQHFWDLVKWEVWQVVEESRTLRWMYPRMNATFLALIPKAEESNTPEKYRPIALCNIIYKIVSKVVASRLKPMLPLIISPEQFGYVEGRHITDGIILTREIIHSLKQSKQPGMLLKIDLSKAFDSISWDYLQKILKAFGFSPSWVRWISNLISSSFFSILINSIPSPTFRPSRGIRQGDPLSPFLFVILAEGLGRSIKSAILSRKLKGIAFHQTPAISHQQFVDDNMLFGHPSAQEARSFNSILEDFSLASGALINKVKSQIFFFNTPPSTQRAISRILGFTITSLPSKYLGAPLMSSALKHSSWNNLLEKLEVRLLLWTHRALNMASRIVLIKAVLQSMPLYLFSILSAPKWVLKAIKQLQRNFLWGSKGPNRKWALVKWEKACLPKNAGTPWAALWTAKYARNLPLEERIRMTEVSKGSIIWNSAIKHRDLIQKHSFWEVKDGCMARFWEDSWQQLPNLKDIIQGIRDQDINQHDTVNHFWRSHNAQEHREWKEANHILPSSTEQIQLSLSAELQKRRILKLAGMDTLRLGYEEKGTFTTKEAYRIIIKDIIIKDKLWDKIWNPPIWLKVSTFLWLLSHNRILTWDNLRKRNFIGPSICLNCKQDEESIIHLMQTCPLGRKLWEKVTFRCQRDGRVLGDLKSTLRNWTQKTYQSNLLNTLWQITPGLLMWNIWKERNRRIFKDQSMTLEHIWKGLHHNIQETLSLKCWSQEDLASSPQEQAIWNNW
eukprot:PITA_29767